jgi:hypothetical protein
LLALLIPALACAQATVDESKESAFVYVDTAVGSDSNPGTQTLPLKTISAGASLASANNSAGVGTRVIINPGLYREAINITAVSNWTSAPITFQAAQNGTVFVSGAVQYMNWAPDTQNASAFTTSWPYQWGVCAPDGGDHPLEQPIVLRREMVMVNGVPITEVLSMSQMVAPGTFFVDETAGQLHVWPPTGTNMATADVEVAVVPEVVHVAAHGLNSLNGLVFRGLVFEYAASCRGDAAVFVDGNVTNILFDSDRFSWNSAAGLGFNAHVSNVTVTNSTANHNGAIGFNGYRTKNALWQNVQASYNNWRGAQGAYYTWNTGGMHLFSHHNDTVTGATFVYNQTYGVHWDTDVANASADSMFAADNAMGLLAEVSEGPISITNSTFCTSMNVIAAHYGLVLRNSQQVSVGTSTFYNNNVSQVLIRGEGAGLPITNWETNQPYNLITQNFSFHDNTIVGTGMQDMVQDIDGGAAWTNFVATLSSDNNKWWNINKPAGFKTPSDTWEISNTLAQWQASTGQDASSVWAAPAVDPGAKCSVQADLPDLWLLADNGIVTADPAGVAVFNLQTAGLGGFDGPVALRLDGAASVPGGSVTLSKSTLTSNDSATLTIKTSMTTPPGTYTFTVIGSSAAITRTVSMSVVVPVNTVWLSTDSLVFPNEPVNFTSPPQTVTVTNLSSDVLPMAGLTVPPGFGETDTCGTQLAPGASCAIAVTFSPKSLTTYSGKLAINDGNPVATQFVSLTGTVVGSGKVTLSSTLLSFGNQVYLKPSAGKTVTVTNTGTGLMNISSIAVTGANPDDFTQTSTCGPTLDVNASCAITVAFTPIALGARTAAITLTDDAVKSPQTFTVSGTGTTAITYSPHSLSFSNTSIGSASVGKAVTVSNASGATLEVPSIVIAGANPGDYVQTNTCGGWIAGGSSCVITVQFTPQTAFSRPAVLQINDSDPLSPQNVTLSGTGYAISISPKAVSFGSVRVGRTASKTITVTNLGPAPVSVGSVVLSGATAGDYRQTNTCAPAIPGGTSCTITVTFTPSVTGARNGTLTITDADPTSPQTLAITGNGS